MKRMFLIVLFSVMALFAIRAATVEAQFNSPKPPTKNNGEKWRIAYYEGGEWRDYQKVFTTTIQSLMENGWIHKNSLPAQEGDNTETLWKWLSDESRSDYLRFVPDGHYSAGWDQEIREKLRKELTTRLNQGEFDLLLAFGTRAGEDFVNNDHHVNTLLLSVSDPISAGIIKSESDSGYDHVHSYLMPGRYSRQIRTFHELVKFKKLGVAYEDTKAGRSIAAIDQIQEVAKERNFEIISCSTIDNTPDISEAERSAVNCYKELAGKTDAIYVTLKNGVNPNTLPEIVSICWENKIPAFSQAGAVEVEQGLLMSIAHVDFAPIGMFEATTISWVLNGTRPRDLPQVFNAPLKIAFNLKTAKQIGYTPTQEVFIASDEIYEDIKKPKKE